MRIVSNYEDADGKRCYLWQVSQYQYAVGYTRTSSSFLNYLGTTLEDIRKDLDKRGFVENA